MYSTPCPRNLELSVLLVRTGNVPGLMRVPGTVTSNPFWWVFPQPWVVSSHTCACQYSDGSLRKTLWRSQKFFFYVVLFSLVLYSEVFSHHIVPGISAPSQLQESTDNLGSSFMCCSLETLSRQKYGKIVGLPRFVPHFSYIFVLCYLMSNVLTTISYILSMFFGCFRWKGKSSNFYSSCVEAETIT